MFVGKVSFFKYLDKGSELTKFVFQSVDGLNALDFHCNNKIGEAFFIGCWLGFALWDERAKMRKALINKYDIIINLDYLKEVERHGNVW